MQNSKAIIEKTKKYVADIFETSLPNWAVYHNLQHTIDTVKGCKKIASGSKCSSAELEILIIAAWFHDTGYLESPKDHEKISAAICKSFLIKNKYAPENIESIIKCIIATKLNHNPQNMLEAIICDADLISLGQKKYHELNDLLKLEIELRENKKIDDFAWLKRSLKFLQSHKFHTGYAQVHFNSQLEKNVQDIQEQIIKSKKSIIQG